MTKKRGHVLFVLCIVSACLGDPVGPGSLVVSPVGGKADTVWVGAPGEVLPSSVTLRVTDDDGRPIPGASLTWEAVGRDAQVIAPTLQTNAAGIASAGWQLGTIATEEQQIHVVVSTAHHQNEVVIRARAVPHIVSQIRVLIDTPTVLRLGDTLPVGVNAIDPYGNVFAAPDVVLSVADSAIGEATGQGLVGGPRRGQTIVRVASHGVEAGFPLRVTQYVAAIVPVSDTLRFSALGAERLVAYVVRDDRGRIVADTTAALSVADTAVAQLGAEYVRSVAPGVTALRLTVGPVAATIVVGVQQRVGSLRLVRDTIRLDALMDTTTVSPIVHDSLGSPIPDPSLEYMVSDAKVAKFATGRTLEALRPGSAIVTVRDTATGISTSAPVVVQQVIAKISLTPAQISFDALGDTLTVGAVAEDRLGSVVADAALVISVGDARVAALQPVSQLRSVANGQTLVIVSDPETGIVGTADVRVEQRVADLKLTADSIGFDALGDSIPLGFAAWDRLGAPVAVCPVSYSSTDTSVITVSDGGVVRSGDNGAALVIARSADGPVDTVRVIVVQRVDRIVIDRDSVLFESLQAVQPVRVTPIDRLGAPVRGATVGYMTEDSSVAAVDTLGQVRAVGNGATRVVASADGHSVLTDVRVSQRVVRVTVPTDTIRFQSLGDTVTLKAIGIDSLGSPAPGGIADVVVADTTVAGMIDPLVVRARANGVTSADLTVAGVTGRVVVAVDQVAVTLSVSVTFGSPVITLPVGAAFPLACQAFDRNGFQVFRDPTFAGSLKGTVAGVGCADARVERSGYDTLRFSMGTAEARVPVIVATAPDSVGVISAAQPLPAEERIRFVGEDLANPQVLALRPLVQDILAAYGNPTNSIDRARALRDWIARTAIHPHPAFHRDGSSSNVSVLPPGKTWADVNALPVNKFFDEDNVYWRAVGYDGYAMLDRLLGTLNTATGLRADDGMMVHVEGVRYRIRDVESYHYTLCTFQVIMLNALWAADGLQGLLISTLGHDPAAVFIPEFGRWVYEDPTFNEEYLLDGTGDPLSPTDLLALSSRGAVDRLHATKLPGPSFDPQAYIGGDSYLTEHPDGMLIMGSQLNSRVVGVTQPGGWPTLLVQIDVPRLAIESPYNDPSIYVRVTAAEAFPTLGPTVDELRVEDSVYVVRLSSTFPGHNHFERRVVGGMWETVGNQGVLPVGACRVEYRSADAVGNISASTVMDVWVPRGEEFVSSGPPEALRRQARYCM